MRCVVLWTLLVLTRAEVLQDIGDFLPPFLANGIEELVTAAAATCEALPLDILFSGQFIFDVPTLEVVEYSRQGRRTYKLSRAAQRLQEYHPQTLVLYIPGWWNTPTDESSRALVNALLTKHPVILVLNTRQHFGGGYVSSTARVKPIAQLLYKFVKTINQFIPVSAIHLIGFSLGAHVAGVTGKFVQKGMGKSLGMITALDPAKPCFTRNSQYRLNKRDAKFVQVIHTSAGILGLEQPIGHADVYVNGVAVKQPECSDRSITVECDHAQAWRLYATSVVDEKALMARRCSGWKEVNSGTCSGNETVVGYSMSTSKRGMYLYKTEERIVKRKADRKLRVFNPFDIFSDLF